MTVSKEFIESMPKTELHLHIEGSLEPELMLQLAERNKITVPFSSAEDMRKTYHFTKLQDFLDVYYQNMAVLQTEQDFYDLTMAYLTKAAAQNVRHTEIFFDPQEHTARNIDFGVVVNGISRALDDGQKKFGISAHLIMCFLRHLDEQAAFQILEQAIPYKDKIIGIGLDSSEIGNPPSKFERVFAKARQDGFGIAVAHAGEEGPSDYIWQALDLLHVNRIDHGNRSLDDPALIQELIKRDMALTVCPLSNLKLFVVKDMTQHPLKKMLSLGLKATVNSDDPAYFGGYMNENYLAVTRALSLNKDDILTLAQNGINASILPVDRKQFLHQELNEFAARSLCWTSVRSGGE